MPRNVMQDVIPSDRRSIRNVVLPHKKPRAMKRDSGDEYEPPRPKRTVRSGGSGRRPVLVGFAIVCVLLLIGGLLTVFGKATLTITPKIIEADIDTNITAYTDDTGPVSYSMIDLSLEETKQAPATDERYVERQAQGTITIYNNFDESDQRLITNTRFETTDGLIYRIRESVVVPGKQGTVPGSVDVVVYADEAGENYNKTDAEFTIPGFKGDPRFNAFSAKTKTALSGGFKGTEKQVAEGVKSAAINDLDVTLKAELLRSVREQVPENMVLIDSLATFDFVDINPTSEGDMVTIGRRGTIHVPLFGAEELAHAVAEASGTDSTLPMTIDSFDTLTVTAEKPTDAGVLTCAIQGHARFVASVDEQAVGTAVAGRAKSALPEILKDFSGVARAEASITPFWTRSFPADASKINIVIEK